MVFIDWWQTKVVLFIFPKWLSLSLTLFNENYKYMYMYIPCTYTHVSVEHISVQILKEMYYCIHHVPWRILYTCLCKALKYRHFLLHFCILKIPQFKANVCTCTLLIHVLYVQCTCVENQFVFLSILSIHINSC